MITLPRFLTYFKKRNYTVWFVAIGFMGNRYIAATVDVDVSDYSLRKYSCAAADYAMAKNYSQLVKHYKPNGTYISQTIENN